MRAGDDKLRNLSNGVKGPSPSTALVTMPAIASTEALLLTWHEAPVGTGLSSPNRIRDQILQLLETRPKFLALVNVPQARSTAFMKPHFSRFSAFTPTIPIPQLQPSQW